MRTPSLVPNPLRRLVLPGHTPAPSGQAAGTAAPAEVSSSENPHRARLHVPDVARRLRSALSKDDSTRFRKAVEKGDAQTVQGLLIKGVDPLTPMKNGSSPLRHAANEGHLDVLKVLIDDDRVDPNNHPDTRVAYWLTRRRTDVVNLLLNHDKVEPDQQRENGETLLHRAAREGRRNWAMLLMGKSDCTAASPEGLAPLHLAACFDHHILAYMLDAGADPNLKDGNGMTPLHHALISVRGEVLSDVVATLGKAGADPFAVDDDGRTPLDLVSGERRAQAATGLLKAAMESGFDHQILAHMLDAGADPNVRDANGRTPLHHVLVSVPTDDLDRIAARLGAAGADPFSIDNEGHMPFDLVPRERRIQAATATLQGAVEAGRTEHAAALFRAGAEADAETRMSLVPGLPMPRELVGETARWLDGPSRDSLKLVNTSTHAAIRATRFPHVVIQTQADLVEAAAHFKNDIVQKITLRAADDWSDADLLALNAFNGLQEVSLRGQQWVRDGHIAQLPRGLQSLDLVGCTGLTGEFVPSLPDGLQEISWRSRAWLTDDHIAALPRGLKALDLGGCSRLTARCVRDLPDGLRELSLRGHEWLRDDHIAALPRGLRSLNLSGCTGLTDACVQNLPPALEEADFGHCRGLIGAGMGRFDQVTKELRKLSFNGCYNLADASFMAHLPPALEEARFGLCWLVVTDETVSHIPRGVRKLQVSGCSGITDTGVARLPHALEELDLGFCTQLSNEAVMHIPSSVKKLRLDGCVQLTDACIPQLPSQLEEAGFSHCRELGDGVAGIPASVRTVDIRECHNVSDASVAQLTARGVTVLR